MIDGMASSKPRRIVILAFPGVQPLDVIGPAEVFAGADGLAGGGAYTVEVVAKEPGPIARARAGYSLVPKTTIAALPRADRHPGRCRRVRGRRG